MNLLWYSPRTIEAAKSARMPAVIFSTLGATVWSAIAVVGLFRPSIYGNWAFLYAALLILITWGMIRMRREAAFAGLLFCFVGFISHWGTIQTVREGLMALIYILALRGIFSYVRLREGLNNIHDIQQVAGRGG